MEIFPRSFDVFFDLCLNKQLSKQLWGWWSETPWCSLWRHCNVIMVTWPSDGRSVPLVLYQLAILTTLAEAVLWAIHKFKLSDIYIDIVYSTCRGTWIWLYPRGRWNRNTYINFLTKNNHHVVRPVSMYDSWHSNCQIYFWLLDQCDPEFKWEMKFAGKTNKHGIHAIYTNITETVCHGNSSQPN